MSNGNGKSNGRHKPAATSEQIARLFNATPPHDHAAECALLGSMILDWRVIGDVIDIVRSADDLYKQAHAAIFEKLVALFNKGQALDVVMLRSDLEIAGMLEQVGGLDYLLELAESVPSAASAVYYAGIVADRARKRQLARIGAQIMETAHGPDDAADLIDRAEGLVFNVSDRGTVRGEPVSVGSVLQDCYDDLQTEEGQRRGIETGMIELDEMTNGLQPGDLIIIAARPSMGKTALSMQIAEWAAGTTRQPTAFFSLEMSRQQVGLRMMCHRAGVSMHAVRRNMITQDQFAQLSLSVRELSEAPLHIDDTPGLSIMQLRARARRLAARHGLKLIVVDYLQLMTAPGAESRQQEVSGLSRGLKVLARELNVPVICLSQLNRKAESRSDNRPKMSDLRESGAIEQDADVVMLLHREDYYHKGEEGYVDTGIAEVIVEKQRQGPTGVVKLVWDGPTMAFKTLAYSSASGGEHGGMW